MGTVAAGFDFNDYSKQTGAELAERLAMNLPEAIKKHRQFLLWRFEPDPAGKKPRKVPYYVSGTRRNGTQGEPADLAQMATFSQALEALEAGGYDGIGIAMLPGGGLVGVDLDGCLTGGKINPDKAPFVAGTYSEVSPSGKGVRGLYFGEYADRKHLDAGVEVFCTKGFLTLTGDRRTIDDIVPLPAAVRSKFDALFASQRDKSTRSDRLNDAEANDPVYQRLAERGMIRKNFGGGRIGITCPFEAEHTTGDGDADCVYFLPNTNGFAQGNFNCFHAHCSERSQEAFLRAIGIETGARRGAKWGEPQPLTEKTRPAPYPIEALPGAIREAIEEVQDFVKAPVALVAATAISALSVAAQAHCDVERAKKLSGPSSLFMLSIADSGERKSSCDEHFTTPIREYEAKEAERVKPLMKEYEAARAAWEAKRSGLLESIKRQAKDGKPSGELETKLIQLHLHEPVAPRVAKLLLLDETPESLAWKLSERYAVAGILSSEAGLVFGAHGMNRETSMRNLALLNILWDGDVFEAGRKVSGNVRIESARLTLGLQIQETTLRTFFERSEGLARGTGFLARFLVSWPESTMGGRLFTEAPEHWPALTVFNERITELLNQPLPLDDRQILCPQALTLDVEAKAAWVRFHNTIEGALCCELCDVKDVASKSADNAARLAALFHTFIHGSRGAISVEVFEAAAALAAWHLNESLRFFSEIALPAELSNARRLDNYLIDQCRRAKTTSIPTVQILQLGPSGLRTKKALEEAAGVLDDLDRARLVKEGKRKLIEVNPVLLEVAR